MYMIAKHLHLTAAILTFVFFLIRFALLMRQSPALQQKWLKILPHIFDTLLLVTIVWLCVQLSIYPLVNGWASAKLTGLVFYILSIFLTLRWAKTTTWRIVGAVSVVVWFVMTARLGLAGPAMFA
ncbi:SirB2 family protein [Glaciecola sp. SC05]|uniref:SirB2 family protein n=1 Tax=Glaciecola sp. SC05 TaxID=1987355 RepID=UPI003529CCB7